MVVSAGLVETVVDERGGEEEVVEAKRIEGWERMEASGRGDRHCFCDAKANEGRLEVGLGGSKEENYDSELEGESGSGCTDQTTR